MGASTAPRAGAWDIRLRRAPVLVGRGHLLAAVSSQAEEGPFADKDTPPVMEAPPPMTSSKLNALPKAHLLTPSQRGSGCGMQVWGDTGIQHLTFTSARDGNWTKRLTSHSLSTCAGQPPQPVTCTGVGIRVSIQYRVKVRVSV